MGSEENRRSAGLSSNIFTINHFIHYGIHFKEILNKNFKRITASTRKMKEPVNLCKREFRKKNTMNFNSRSLSKFTSY